MRCEMAGKSTMVLGLRRFKWRYCNAECKQGIWRDINSDNHI